MNQFILRPSAVRDLEQAYDRYEAEREGLGEEFVSEVRECIERITTTPQAYVIVHRDTRRALVRRFPYGVFFRVVVDTTVIVACYHLRRRPASWKKRR